MATPCAPSCPGMWGCVTPSDPLRPPFNLSVTARADIPADHSYPVRAIMPGHVGVRRKEYITTKSIPTEDI
eukprot:710728-Pyramimonas_sp.AAC.1